MLYLPSIRAGYDINGKIVRIELDATHGSRSSASSTCGIGRKGSIACFLLLSGDLWNHAFNRFEECEETCADR
jgi:hypothetical protein